MSNIIEIMFSSTKLSMRWYTYHDINLGIHYYIFNLIKLLGHLSSVQDNFIDHQKGNWQVGVLSRGVSGIAVPLVTVVVWPSCSVAMESSFLDNNFFRCCYGCWARNGKLSATSEEYLPCSGTKFSTDQSWEGIDCLCCVVWVLCCSNVKYCLMIKLISITTLVNLDTCYILFLESSKVCRFGNISQLNSQVRIGLEI